MSHKTLEDYENDGFSIYEPGKKPKAVAQQAPETKIVVIDNKELVHAVERTNQVFQENMATSSALMQACMEKMMSTMADKPDSFTMDINRDERGFMKSVTVTINK